MESTLAAITPEMDYDESALIRPAASLAHIAEVFAMYQELTAKLLTEDDYQLIGRKKFPKRSAWRKLAAAFGVTFGIGDRNIEYDEGYDVIRADFVVRATAPNGRYADGWGGCDRKERCCVRGCQKRHQHCVAASGQACPGVIHFSHPNHDIPATAETRAKNRAAADLFGLGQVSAEEIVDGASRRLTESKPDSAPPQTSTPAGNPDDEPASNAQIAAIKDLALKIEGTEPDNLGKLNRFEARELLKFYAERNRQKMEAANADV